MYAEYDYEAWVASFDGLICQVKENTQQMLYRIQSAMSSAIGTAVANLADAIERLVAE